MISILNLTKTNKLILAAATFLAVLAVGSGRAHAATITVGSGCTIENAIVSVNSTTSQASCSASGAYGTDDTINIPAGTHTLTGSLTHIQENVTINGAGMGSTTIDADGNNSGFIADSVDVTFSNLKITAYTGLGAIETNESNVNLENVEVDGQGSDAQTAIYVRNDANTIKTVTGNNIYIHDINIPGSGGNSQIHIFAVEQRGGGTTNATFQNITIADIYNADGGVNGFMMTVGVFGTLGGNGTLNATMNNVTIDNVGSVGITAPFSSVSFAAGGDSNVNTTVNNATITGTRGITGSVPPLTGVKSAAFYAATAGITSGDVGNAHVSVSNSLLADNQSGGDSSNCMAADFTTGFSGGGSGDPTITSLGHNISDDASCTTFTGSGDQQNVSSIISTLGLLRSNGGNVPTRALLSGSPAISAGGAVLGVTTDARGVSRPSTCPSVGAFQFEGAVCAASTTNAGTNAGAPNTGIHSVSLIGVSIATLLGLSVIGYSITTKRN
ncbi:hypothetical protein EKI60_02065 [Candidatus Saccharibacteria bacterium]|nr:MAG: hypothetical protein EKI60_02065 [Candidatus Saccharibacteria bacterium]